MGVNTINAFKQFKKDSFQNQPELIGEGSIGILIKLLDSKAEDVIEKEDEHPNQPSLSEPLKPALSYDKIDWTNFNAPVSKYFTVGELLRYDRRRIPNSTEVKVNIFKLCQELDKIREAWGKPIGVSSGYRPPAVNRACGGARYSQHLTGNAADIFPIGGNIYEFQKWLDKRWYGALGRGSTRGFVHIDSRNNKGFNSGGSKGPRWNY